MTTREKRSPVELVLWPDPRLKEQTYDVAEDYPAEELQLLIKNMSDVMAALHGVGIAAPQIGSPFRVCIIAPFKGQLPRICINPRRTDDLNGTVSNSITLLEQLNEIEDSLTWISGREGCLSAPHFHTVVNRSSSITLSYEDMDRTRREVTLTGLEAVVAQHELDHLDGVCIVDKAPVHQQLHYSLIVRR
jgi:peptide deformylase